MRSLELKHHNPVLDSKLRETRDLLKMGRVPGNFIPILLDEKVLGAFAKASSLAKEAPIPWEYVEPSEGSGFQTQSFGTTRLRHVSDTERENGLQRLEAAYQEIENALRRIEEDIKQECRKPLRLLLLIIGLALVFTSITFVVWGVLQGSEIEMAGKDGAATLLLGTGVTLLSGIYIKDRSIRTLPNRIRARLAACRLWAEYEKIYQCFMDAIQALDKSFQTIKQHAEDITHSTKNAD